MLNFLTSNAAALGILGAAIAFAWSVVQFMLVRMRDEKHREFEIYHRLIKELVALDPESKVMWIDRQCAVIFELRQFRRYHELTLRTLNGLRAKWSGDPDFTFPRMIEELDLTVDYIKSRSR
ncbi:hypothetical protein [Roseateles sp.]|uniref:hypothetical protein n=1 Tax=Roseateles sp. TaxID=1971397 RepID=UPI003BAD7BB1